jgi:SSS family solute:Na+ symporter
MNASATVFSVDIYRRYFKPSANEKQKLRVLHIATVIFGLGGMIAGVAMIGIKSVLDVWWMLSGILASGMLGLFLLGIISRRTGNTAAMTATFIGVLVVLWMTFPSIIPDQYQYFRNRLDVNMTIVVGTLSIFLVGMLFSRFKTERSYKAI